eukprot:TRINITY_DN1398_c1_g2_i2.p1 TRINITY_DN1398_c1_g2~~TRINITY_DN1398_c1_g2_i2.p1  ORF type:complete len:893 (+),score=270.95 TRINITY_DN1398_c1_g2_i2:84-2681(+)
MKQPVYVTTPIDGKNHKLSYTSELHLGDMIFKSLSEHRTKKDAEQDAALVALKSFGETGRLHVSLPAENKSDELTNQSAKLLLQAQWARMCKENKKSSGKVDPSSPAPSIPLSKNLDRAVQGRMTDAEIVERLQRLLKGEKVLLARLCAAFYADVGVTLKSIVGSLIQFLDGHRDKFTVTNEGPHKQTWIAPSLGVLTPPIAELQDLHISEKQKDAHVAEKSQTASPRKPETSSKKSDVTIALTPATHAVPPSTSDGSTYRCQCGSTVNESNRAQHEKSGKHKTFLFKLDLEKESKSNSPKTKGITIESKSEIIHQAIDGSDPSEVIDDGVIEEVILEEDEESDEESEDEDSEDSQDEIQVENQPAKKGANGQPRIKCECGRLINDQPTSKTLHEKSRMHKTWEQKMLVEKVVNKGLEEAKANPEETLKKLEKCSNSIQEYFVSVNPTNEEIRRREIFRRSIEDMIRTQWDDASLHLFGSSATTLFSKDSDLDFCLIIPDTHGEETTIIRHLARYFKKQGAGHIISLLSARVPILKIPNPNRTFYYKFDLCVNRPLGTHNSQLIRAYLDTDPRARPLAFILKTWSKMSRVYNPSGGLSSYAMYLLLIYFLQVRQPAVLPNLQLEIGKILTVMGYNCYFLKEISGWKSENRESLGSLLGGFFLFYGEFDFMKYAVCIRTGRPTLKSETAFKACPPNKPMVIEDPFEIDFNCSRLVKDHNVNRIQGMFKVAYHKLLVENSVNSLLVEDPSVARRSRSRGDRGRGDRGRGDRSRSDNNNRGNRGEFRGNRGEYRGEYRGRGEFRGNRGEYRGEHRGEYRGNRDGRGRGGFQVENPRGKFQVENSRGNFNRGDRGGRGRRGGQEKTNSS